MRELCSYFSDSFSDIYKGFSASVRSSRTLDEYTGYLNLLCNFLKKDFLDINDEDAGRYFQYLSSRCANGTLSRHTVGVRLSCYNSIANYIDSIGTVSDYVNPFRYIRRPEIVCNQVSANKVPSLEELDVVAEAVRDEPMWYLIFSLASRVGMSATDIINIRSNMIGNKDGRSYIIYPAKTTFEEPRVVTLPEDVDALLRNYMLVVVPNDSGCIFYNKYGNPLTLRNIDSYFERLSKKTTLAKKYTLKDFRTRAVLELADAGASAKTISEYTGLKMDRAQCYVHSTHILNDECPADLVNYRLVVDDFSGTEYEDSAKRDVS